MNANDPNIEMLELIVNALGKVSEELVFVGGCATGLLITDVARPPVRATKDVDVIASVTSITKYYDLEKRLKEVGFSQSVTDEPICRWRSGQLILDVMPTDEKILGFSNRWYSEAVGTAINYRLPSTKEIRVITSPYFIGTKIEAFHGRGKGDFRASHDIEDILSIVDGRPELTYEVKQSTQELRYYVADEIEALLEYRHLLTLCQDI